MVLETLLLVATLSGSPSCVKQYASKEPVTDCLNPKIVEVVAPGYELVDADVRPYDSILVCQQDDAAGVRYVVHGIKISGGILFGRAIGDLATTAVPDERKEQIGAELRNLGFESISYRTCE